MSVIAEAVVDAVREQLKSVNRVVVAVSGPQGSGKTTVTQEAARLLSNRDKISTLAISLDDFYYPHEELQSIAQQGNPLLKHRGLPGTHDTGLLREFLSAFKSGKQDLKVPIYDKSLHNGAGDRSGFVNVANDTRAVLLEGWMVGFMPIGESKVEQKAGGVANLQLSIKPELFDLQEIDLNLLRYIPIWHEFNYFVRLVPADLRLVYKWRLQQEHHMKQTKGMGMTDEEVQKFVDQYMPCYYLYNDTLPMNGTSFEIGADHEATEIGK